MTRTSLDDPIEPAPIADLRDLLVSGGLFDGINLRITEQDRWGPASHHGRLHGQAQVLLATLSDPSELDDLNSLTCRPPTTASGQTCGSTN